MNRALYSGLSATLAQQLRIDVASNNLANVSTIGFKASRVNFQDAYYQTLRPGTAARADIGGVAPVQVGTGVTASAVSALTDQGAVQRTGQPLDAAVDGTGMFVVDGPEGVRYTRDGSFELDDTNTLIMASSGLRVQGWSATDGVVDTAGPVGDLVFPLRTMRSPKATSTVVMSGNLQSDTAVGDTVSASVNVYDSLGATHSMALKFTKTADNEWDVVADCEGTTGTASHLTFTAGGIVSTGGTMALTAPMPGGAADISVSIDLSTATQFVSGEELAAGSQDGYGSAALQSINIADGGVIEGAYSDGRPMTLGQIALAGFSGPAGLNRAGNNLYAASASSGTATVGAARSGGRGNIVGLSLEMSNTDLTGSFLEMILAQRAYQAGARAITTANTLLDEAIQLARG